MSRIAHEYEDLGDRMGGKAALTAYRYARDSLDDSVDHDDCLRIARKVELLLILLWS